MIAPNCFVFLAQFYTNKYIIIMKNHFHQLNFKTSLTLMKKIKPFLMALFVVAINFDINAQCVTADEADLVDLCVTATETTNGAPTPAGTFDIWDAGTMAAGTDGTDDISLTLEAVVFTPNANGTCDDGDFTITGCVGPATPDWSATTSDDCVCTNGYVCVTVDMINGFSSEASGLDFPFTSVNGGTEGHEAMFAYVTAGTDANGGAITLPTVNLAALNGFCEPQYNAGSVSAFVGATGPGTFAVDQNTGVTNDCATSGQSGEDTESGDNPNDNSDAQTENPNWGLNATDIITQYKIIYFFGNSPGTDCDADGDTGVGTNPSANFGALTFCPPVETVVVECGACTEGTAGLVITELSYDPSGAQGIDGDCEYIEIYNSYSNSITTDASTTVTLSGGTSVSLPAGITIAPGEYIILTGPNFSSMCTFATPPPAGTQIIDVGIPGTLGNGGEDVTITLACAEDAAAGNTQMVTWSDALTPNAGGGGQSVYYPLDGSGPLEGEPTPGSGDCTGCAMTEYTCETTACPDITDGTLSATVGGAAVTDICTGDVVTVCVDVDLTNDPTAVVEFSNDGGATWTDGTPDVVVPPVQNITVNIAGASNPYTITPAAGPYYVGDMVTYQGNNTHPIEVIGPGGVITSGQTTTGSFTVSQAGNYTFDCLTPSHTAMFNTLVFEERPQATEFCFDFTETNAAPCDPVTVSYQAQFNVTTLADNTCSLDNQTMDAADAVVSVDVYPAPTTPTITVDDAVCNYTITPACPNDVLTPSTFGPANPGDDPAPFDVMVSNAGGCMENFSIDPPACQATACDITAISGGAPVCSADGLTYTVTVTVTGTDPNNTVTLDDAGSIEMSQPASGTVTFTYSDDDSYNIVVTDTDGECMFPAITGGPIDCTAAPVCNISDVMVTQNCTNNGEEYEVCVSFTVANPGATGSFDVYIDAPGTATPATLINTYTYAAYDAAIAGGATCFTIPVADFAGDASDLEAGIPICIADSDAPAPGTGLPPGSTPPPGGIPTFACPQIYGILHNACAPAGGDEGPNEFVVIVNGANPTDVSSILVDTPSGSDYDDFNTVTPPANWTCPCCVYLDETGTVPAGGVIVATSAANTSTLDFTNLCTTAGTIYVIQDDGIGSTGHFSNSNPRATELQITGTASCDGNTTYSYTNANGNDGDYTTFAGPDSPAAPGAGSTIGTPNAGNVDSSGECTPQIAPASEIECFGCTTLDEILCAACPVVTTPLATIEKVCDGGAPVLDATSLVLDDATLAQDGTGNVIVSWFTDAALTMAFGGTVNHSGVDNCVTEDIILYAAIECVVTPAPLIAAGQTTISVFPSYDVALVDITNTDCTVPTIMSSCANYVFTPNPANPTAPAPGDPATTFNFTVEFNDGLNNVSCFLETFIVVVNCPADGCPSVTPDNADAQICTGTLANQVVDWQTIVDANVAIADANTDAAIVYSTDLPANVAEATPPAAGSVTGIHTGANICVSEMETLYAYLLCFGNDGAAGGGDDSYLLLGKFILTIYPEVEPTSEMTDAAACTTTITAACAIDIFGTATNPTGGANAANWDAATGVYTAAPGDVAGTLDITVTSGVVGSTCIPLPVTINTPACSAMPMIMIDKDDADNTDDTQEVMSGGVATFTITVTNNGSVDLENVVVTDALTPGCDITLTATELATIGNLDAVFNPGESYSYTCTTVGGLTMGFTNVVTVNANEVGDPMSTVTDTDDTEVTIPAMAECAIEVTISQTDCNNGGTIEDASDDVATYDISVIGVNTTGTTYTFNITWADASATNGMGTFNDTQTVVTPVGAVGSFTVTVTDDGNAMCTTTINPIFDGCITPQIPTLSQWGLLSLALLLMIFGAVTLGKSTLTIENRRI